MELTAQTALITGGTAGIGPAYARLMAREGAITGSTLHVDSSGTAI